MTQFRSDTNILLPHNKTIYEVFRLSDRFTTTGTATDAFGRLRISNPVTLFDSQHRYRENEHFNTLIVGTAGAAHIPAESTMNLTVGTALNDGVYRETKRVFAYQPGKSLLIMNTFAMNDPKPGLVQRVGYFSANNGVYLESNGTSNVISFVLRSNATGTTTETRVPQSQWNVDKFGSDQNSYSWQISTEPGRGPLNLSNTNIFWTDIEWLGVGDVRCGFVVDGMMVPAHIFHNDNARKSAYMSTACLPIRYEVFNHAATGSASFMKQICSTVISEGGYQLFGSQRSAGSNVAIPVTLTNASQYYPVVSLRLKSETPDSVVIPTNISVLGLGGNGTRLQWRLIEGATITGGTWETIDANSAVQYNSNATSMTGGTSLRSGFVYVSQQGSATGILGPEVLFRNQLKRNTFNGTNTTFTLAVAGAGAADTCVGTLDWEEII